MAHVLVADDEEGFRTYVKFVLERDGHVVAQAEDGEVASRLADAQSFDLVITDMSMPRLHGMDLVRRLREQQPDCEIIVFTAHGSVQMAVDAMKLGAFDFIEKPLEGPDQLSLLAGRALERRHLRNLQERASREQSDEGETPLTHGDPAMAPVVRAVEKVAPTDATVLLLGESGSGKEVAARAIHRNSRRADGPFVVVNCAALPDNLIESELFGHEKGAFTGATERRRGRIELAAGGTFFLDEVGELKPEVQAKLLRVLQDGTFEHLGGRQEIRADVRWIAATNRDLEAMMANGSFREDLYHRLALFPIRLPSLRERRRDILPIADAILDEIARRRGTRLRLADDARAALEAHRWRGNVRELANVLERGSILADDDEIRAADLAIELSTGEADGSNRLENAEKTALEEALRDCGGSRRQAARLLGISERTLYDKMKRYGVR